MLRMYGKFEGLGCLSCWCWKCFFGGWGPIRWPVCVILVFQIILYFSPGSRQEMMQFHLHISFQMGVGKPPTSPDSGCLYLHFTTQIAKKRVRQNTAASARLNSNFGTLGKLKQFAPKNIASRNIRSPNGKDRFATIIFRGNRCWTSGV